MNTVKNLLPLLFIIIWNIRIVNYVVLF